MKKGLYLLSLLLIVGYTHAQQAKVTTNLNFTGKVGNYPVEMALKINKYNDSVSGSYYYIKSGRDHDILLSGMLNNGILNLTESTYNLKKRKFEDTGYFNMTYTAQTSLNGSWQKTKNTTESDQKLLIKLSCRENSKLVSPTELDFILIKSKANYDNITANASKYFTLNTLKINKDKKPQWTLSGFDPHDLILDEVELEDLNFDGTLDIKIPIYFPDLAKNDYGFIYFIYNQVSKNFQKDPFLNELGVILFDPLKKEVLKTDADGSGNETYSNYSWHNGKLFLKKEMKLYENDAYTHYNEYQIQNGKSVNIKSYKRKG